MSELKGIVDSYVREHGSSQTWVATRMGLSRQALSGWWTRGLTHPPEARLLRALAVATRTPYREVLDAALVDYGYLPEEEVLEHGDSSAEKSDDKVVEFPSRAGDDNEVAKRAARGTTDRRKGKN